MTTAAARPWRLVRTTLACIVVVPLAVLCLIAALIALPIQGPPRKRHLGLRDARRAP